MSELRRYAAFISYSSKDAAFARRLHRALERYGIPTSLGSFDLGGGKKNRVYPVFRDREELSAGQLGDQIESNLRAAASLIVVCSPNSAASPWVQNEIEYFVGLGRQSKIFAIVADTAPLLHEDGTDATQSCFPPAFRGDALAGDKLEPLAADARKGKDGFRNAWLKVVAGMIGVSPGQILDRDQRRRMQQAFVAGATSVAAVAASLAALAVIALSIRDTNENRASIFAQEADRRLSQQRYASAMLIALAGDPAARRGSIAHVLASEGHATARMAMAGAYTQNRLLRVVAGPPGWGVHAFGCEGRRAISLSKDDGAQVWEVDTGRVLLSIPTSGSAINKGAFSPNCEQVIVGSLRGIVRVWDIATQREVHKFEANGGQIGSISFSSDGARVAIGWEEGNIGVEVRVVELASDRVLQSFFSGEHLGPVVISPDGTLVATGTGTVVQVHDVSTGRLIRSLPDAKVWVDTLEFSPNGAFLIAGLDGGEARVWEVMTGAAGATFAGQSAIRTARYSPNGAFVYLGLTDGTAKVWNATGGSVVQIFEDREHEGTASAFAFSADGKRALVGATDGVARWWGQGEELSPVTYAGFPRGVGSVVYSTDGARIAVAAGDARVLAADTGRIIQTFVEKSNLIRSIALSPDGSRVATGSREGARLWDISSGRMIATYDADGGDVTAVAISPDGTSLLVGSSDGVVRLLDLQTGHVVKIFRGHAQRVSSVAFSPDSKRVLTASLDGTARLWDAGSGNPLQTFEGHRDGIASAAFSSDGTRILTGSWDGTARLWEVSSASILHSLEGQGRLTSVAFSPDGQHLLTTSEGKARLWDSASGRLIQTFNEPGASLSSAVFSRDGTRVVAGSGDAKVRLWPISPMVFASADEQVRLACSALQRMGVTSFTAEDLQRFPVLRNEPRQPCASLR